MENKTEERQQQQKELNSSKKPIFKWLERMGVGAFIFFTIKGLIWLAVFFGLFRVLGCA